MYTPEKMQQSLEDPITETQKSLSSQSELLPYAIPWNYIICSKRGTK